MTSCSKESIEPQGLSQVPQKQFVTEAQGETQILNFLEVYEAWKTNPNTTFNDMAKEDAVWLMEASINYKNAFQLSYWENRKAEESNYAPNLVEGNSEVFMGSSILSTFALMDAAVSTQKTNNDHNMILVVDLYLDEENDSQIDMRSISASSVPIQSLSDIMVIGADDYWKPSMLMGKCDIYSGDFAGVMDAAERVEDIINHNWWFNHYRNIYNPQDVIYSTNVVYVHHMANTSNDPNGLWGDEPLSTCLSPTDIQGVLLQNQNVAFLGIPTGSQLISTDYVGGWIIVSGSPAFHTLDKVYGVPHIQ